MERSVCKRVTDQSDDLMPRDNLLQYHDVQRHICHLVDHELQHTLPSRVSRRDIY